VKYLRALIPLVVFLGLVWFLGAGLFLNPKEVPSPLINKPAPNFRTDPAGRRANHHPA